MKTTTAKSKTPLRHIPCPTFGYSVWRAQQGVNLIGHEDLVLLNFIECDKGGFQCLSMLTTEEEDRYHILGSKEDDLNTILFSGTDRRMAERYFYHMASRYLE